MKRWQYIALIALVVGVGGYLYVQGSPGALFSSNTDSSATGVSAAGQWRTVERPGDGFKIDMPGDNKELQVPAYDEKGGTEPVHMLTANRGSEITYAVTWQDNPPVSRAGHTIDRILYMARDGMLARTDTTIMSESRGYYRDYPSLDVSARNVGGGILDARLIVAENRLYVLLALFPSSAARKERDVRRFFDSFIPARPSGIPETMPSAAQQ